MEDVFRGSSTVEQLPVKETVGGSSPPPGAKLDSSALAAETRALDFSRPLSVLLPCL